MKKTIIICGADQNGEKTLKATIESYDTIGFTHDCVLGKGDKYIDLPLIPPEKLQDYEFDFIFIALLNPMGFYTRLVREFHIPTEKIIIETRNIFTQEFLKTESKRFKAPFFIQPSKKNVDAAYFLITSQGRTGSRWLASSLHLHPEIICSAGVDHPFDSLNHHYNEDERESILQQCIKQPTLFAASESVGRHIEELSAKRGVEIEVPRRDLRKNTSVMLEDLDKISPRKANAIGNVHGTTCHEVASSIETSADIFKGKNPVVVAMTRHPITRFESRISAYERFFEKASITSAETKLIDDFCDNNRSDIKKIEKEFKIEFNQRDKLFFYFSRCINYQKYWASEVIIFDIEFCPFERLKSDPDYFSWFITTITRGRVQAGNSLLNKVFSDRNLKAGRGTVADQSSLPAGPQKQFSLWSEWQRQEFRNSVHTYDLQNVYSDIGYDFSCAF